MRPEPFFEERRHSLFVLDDQELHRGILIQNVAPRPGRLTTPAFPPWALAIPRTMGSPNPVPPGDDPVLKGSKTTCSSPAAVPLRRRSPRNTSLMVRLAREGTRAHPLRHGRRRSAPSSPGPGPAAGDPPAASRHRCRNRPAPVPRGWLVLSPSCRSGTCARAAIPLRAKPGRPPGRGWPGLYTSRHEGQFVHAHGPDGTDLLGIGSLLQHLQMAPADGDGCSQLV